MNGAGFTALLLFGAISWGSPARAGCDLQDLLTHALHRPVEVAEFARTPVEADYIRFGKEAMKRAKEGEDFTYYVDAFDQVYLVPGDKLAGKDLLMIKKPGTNEAIVVKESGYFHYSSRSRKYRFEPHDEWALTREEHEKIVNGLEKENPNLEFKRDAHPESEKARVFNCAKILSAQQQGKSFVWDSLVSSNVVTGAGFITQELAGNHILTDPEKLPLAKADMIANNITTSITSPIIKSMVVGNSNVLQDFIVRTSADYFTNTQIKKPLYEYMTPKKKDQKESLGSLLVPYDTGFAVARFFPKRALDRYMLNSLPQALAQSCLEGNEWLVTSAPKLLRITDRFSANMMYLTGRSIYLKIAQ